MRLSFAYTTAKQMKRTYGRDLHNFVMLRDFACKTRLFTCAPARTAALRGRDRSGGAAVPERSGGM